MKIGRLGGAVFVAVLLVCMALVAGCSSDNGPAAGQDDATPPPTCDIYVQGGKIFVVVDLPAEEADYTVTQDLTPAGFSGTPSEVKMDAPASEVNFSQTGNTYRIGYNVVYRDGEIASYTVTIAGDVYGDVTHTLTR